MMPDMSALPPLPIPMRYRACARWPSASLLALIVLGLAWELWLAPDRQRARWR